MNGSLITGLPMADYLLVDNLSSSACKALASGSPYAWRNRVEKASPALSLGTLAHLAILEPERFSDAVVQPECDIRTNAGKEMLVSWLSTLVGEPTVRPPVKAAVGTTLDLYLAELRPRLAASGLTVITEEQRTLCMGMRDAIMSRDHTRSLIEADGECEISGFTTDQDYGVPVKVRPDKLLSGAPIVLSLKTCQSVAERDYLRSAWTWGWHAAAWFYMRAMERITGERHRYWELAVESAPPHDVALYEYSDREIQEGESIMRRGMETFARCTTENLWPSAGWDWDLGEYSIKTLGRQDNGY